MQSQPGKSIRYAILWSIVLGALVHLDWHAGRPEHMRLSLDWQYHWVAGAVLGWLCAWQARGRSASATALFTIITTTGILIGQGLEPVYELLTSDNGWRQIMPPIRWRLFFEFTLSWLAGGGIALIALERRALRPSRSAAA